MELRDWIALAQAVLLSAVGVFFAFRLERLRKTFSRSLKRYDLLHTARYKALEKADDRLVDVQLAEFEAWKALQNKGYATADDERLNEINSSIARLQKVVHAAALSKIKCEKFFDSGFNKKFADVIGSVQKSERYIRDVWNLRFLDNVAQVEDGAVQQMNDACEVSKAAIPEFRKRMGEVMQKDLAE